MNPRLIARTQPLASSASASRVFVRCSSQKSYPFTKTATSSKDSSSSGKNTYPFTRPHDATKVAGPTAPVSRPGPPQDDSRVVSREAAELDSPYGKPDYNAMVDYRTSGFSPVPLRVRDGSEPTETTAASVVSGAPQELQARTVRIFKPTKPATQSGNWHSQHWQMDWDILQRGHRWENPLMGWQSSADFMQGTNLQFKTKEDAIRFAEKQGYEYYVQEPQERVFKPKQYATQFLHSYGPLKQARTK